MKKLAPGAIVGGIILYMAISFWTVPELCQQMHITYTDKQDAIMNFLSTQLDKEGQYQLPALPPDASQEQHEALVKSAEGKPWAQIIYHQSWKMSMSSNMIRGFNSRYADRWFFLRHHQPDEFAELL